MNKKILLVLLTLSFISYAGGQSAAPSEFDRELRKHVEYLASPGLEGRKTGEAGASTAADYVVKQFSQFKLDHGVRSPKAASYLQRFPYVAGVELEAGSFFRVSGTDAKAGSAWHSGSHYMPLANSLSGQVSDVSAVFAGYGITTRDKAYDDLAGIDATGKALIVFDGVPAGGSPMQFAGINIHTKANLAKERGASLLIVIAKSDDFNADRLSRLNYEPTFGETAIPVIAVGRDVAAQMLGLATAAEVAEVEKWMASKAEVPPAIRDVLSKALTSKVTAKVELTQRVVDAYNVIGIIEGNDRQLKSEAIVIGAHYDHLGKGGRSSLSPNSAEIHFGADDNASGTAAMIELARKFAKDQNNKRTLIFIAFGGEEEGLLGSKYYVNNPVWPIENTVAMINLDMVGRLNENKLTIGGIGTADEMKGLVEGSNPGTAGATGTNDARPFALALNEDGFGPSDHASFYGKKIPVLFFFTGTHSDYHKPSDTFDKINYDGLTRIINYVSAIARSIDASGTRPTYKVAQSAPTGGRMPFNVSLGTIPSYGDGNDGLPIDGARDGSPAAKAGLKAGDKIIKLAGKDVRNISDYMFALGVMKAGETYEVIVKRGNETLTMKIVPAPAQPR